MEVLCHVTSRARLVDCTRAELQGMTCPVVVQWLRPVEEGSGGSDTVNAGGISSDGASVSASAHVPQPPYCTLDGFPVAVDALKMSTWGRLFNCDVSDSVTVTGAAPRRLSNPRMALVDMSILE